MKKDIGLIMSNPAALVTTGESDAQTDSESGEEQQSVRVESPELVYIQADPAHIWFNKKHLIESESRRVKPGKYYLTQTGEPILHRVEEIINEEEHEEGFECPAFVDDVANPVDAVVVQHCYTLTVDDEEAFKNGSERVPRYVLETTQAISMGDVPDRVFERSER